MSTQEIASTLIGHLPPGGQSARPRYRIRSQFRSHPPLSGAVHRRTWAAFMPRLGTLAADG